jgi:hypothetical protein
VRSDRSGEIFGGVSRFSQDRRVITTLGEAKQEVSQGAVNHRQTAIVGALAAIEFYPCLGVVVHGLPLSVFDADDDLGPLVAPIAFA